MGVTVQEVIQKLTNPLGKIENTVDTLKFGSPDQEVTGIGVAFIATEKVIKRMIGLGANLLITHEGIFFSHWDNTDLKGTDVYKEKYKRIKDSQLATFRLHDYIHRYEPDMITKGLVHALEWEGYMKSIEPAATIVSIPEMSLQEVIDYVKEKLGIAFVRVVGDLEMKCTSVGLLVGYRGGGSVAIPLFEKYNLELIICGEGPEWETPEYVRDAMEQGRSKSIIFLGHMESEEPGMRYFANVLRTSFSELPVHFLPVDPLFTIK
ncbi:Nif3-like dinuclear metal center hexameric protein [Evansella sp. AB-rgal1]|uniref:Nif3-like dinuclear metal center hexameric protein n=1 Tax=Evansella sp. AB-rgal1 TaxID=3242696 RepID=UPI00359EED80